MAAKVKAVETELRTPYQQALERLAAGAVEVAAAGRVLLGRPLKPGPDWPQTRQRLIALCSEALGLVGEDAWKASGGNEALGPISGPGLAKIERERLNAAKRSGS